MQITAFLFSLLVGVAIVLQGVFNRNISQSWGLTPTIMLTGVVTFVASVVLYCIVRFYSGAFPQFFHAKGSYPFQIHMIIPGLLGLLIIVGVPFAISRMGALNVFVILVCAQMITSLLWDYFAEGIAFSWPRVLAASLTVAAVFLLKLK